MSKKSNGRRVHNNNSNLENETSESDVYDETSTANQDDEAVTIVTPASTSTTIIPATTEINCGYNCSRYVYFQPVTRHTYEMLTNEDRHVIKEGYYKTYDLMTGLRTAASLGGTILLFSLFVLYKMKCRRNGRRKSVINVDKNGSVAFSDLDKQSSFHNGGSPAMLSDVKVVGGGDRQNQRAPMLPDVQPAVHKSRAATNNHSSDANGSHRGIPCSSGGEVSSCRHVVENVTTLPSSDQGIVPRFRLNSDPDGGLMLTTTARHLPSSKMLACGSFLNEPNIDIHIIQPTPNASPCGSIRRLSEDVVNLVQADTRGHSDVHDFIPLLSIPKPSHHHHHHHHQHALKSKSGISATKSKSTKTSSSSSTPRNTSSSSIIRNASSLPANDSASSVENAVVSAALLSDVGEDVIAIADDRGGNCDRMVGIKYIDCSDSDARSICSYDSIEVDATCSPSADNVIVVCERSIHHAQVGNSSRSSNDVSSSKETISETRC